MHAIHHPPFQSAFFTEKNQAKVNLICVFICSLREKPIGKISLGLSGGTGLGMVCFSTDVGVLKISIFIALCFSEIPLRSESSALLLNVPAIISQS